MFWARFSLILAQAARRELKWALIGAQNMFTPKNINSITVIITLEGTEKIKTSNNDNKTVWIKSRPKWQNALNSLSLPQAAQALLETLNFIRECMKMNKIYPNFHFFFLQK